MNLDDARRAVAHCSPASMHYSECSDGTAYISGEWGGAENDGRFYFSLATGELTFARVRGFEPGICGLSTDTIDVSAGVEPSAGSRCRGCFFLCDDNEDHVDVGGAGGTSTPKNTCIIDDQGRVAIPPE